MFVFVANYDVFFLIKKLFNVTISDKYHVSRKRHVVWLRFVTHLECDPFTNKRNVIHTHRCSASATFALPWMKIT